MLVFRSFSSFYSSRSGRRNFTNDAATLHNPWGNSCSLGSNHSANEPRISLQPTNTAGMNTILHEAVMDEGRFCNSISLVFMNQSWTHLFTISLKANCYKLRRVLLCKDSKQGGCDTNLVSSWSKSQQYCYGMSPTSFDTLLVLANFHLCKLWYF